MTAATYNGDGHRATDTTGGTTQDFTWDTVSQVPQVLTDSTNAYIYTGGNAPTEQVNLATGAITYLVADSLGSVRGTINNSGALAGTTSYDAWGNPQTSGGLTAATPFGFAGGYTDPSGLIYLINRYYDPQVGQFISVDPAIAQTLQPYLYAAGDPVLRTDPTGLWSFYSNCYSGWYNDPKSNCYYNFSHTVSQKVGHTLINAVYNGAGVESSISAACATLPPIVYPLAVAKIACGILSALAFTLRFAAGWIGHQFLNYDHGYGAYVHTDDWWGAPYWGGFGTCKAVVHECSH
jgi:RHS repeat-associated protein